MPGCLVEPSVWLAAVVPAHPFHPPARRCLQRAKPGASLAPLLSGKQRRPAVGPRKKNTSSPGSIGGSVASGCPAIAAKNRRHDARVKSPEYEARLAWLCGLGGQPGKGAGVHPSRYRGGHYVARYSWSRRRTVYKRTPRISLGPNFLCDHTMRIRAASGLLFGLRFQQFDQIVGQPKPGVSQLFQTRDQ